MIKSDPKVLIDTSIDRETGDSFFTTGEHKFREKAIISFRTVTNFTILCDWGKNSTLRYKWKILKLKYV